MENRYKSPAIIISKLDCIFVDYGPGLYGSKPLCSSIISATYSQYAEELKIELMTAYINGNNKMINRIKQILIRIINNGPLNMLEVSILKFYKYHGVPPTFHVDDNGNETTFKLRASACNSVLNYIDKITGKFKFTVEQLDQNYSHKEIAIAYRLMNRPINEDNAKNLLEEHSENKSITKLLQARIGTLNQLSRLQGSDIANTKHRNALIAAKEIICGKNDKSAEALIDKYIQDFDSAVANQ
jgi:hypothetical protein